MLNIFRSRRATAIKIIFLESSRDFGSSECYGNSPTAIVLYMISLSQPITIRFDGQILSRDQAHPKSESEARPKSEIYFVFDRRAQGEPGDASLDTREAHVLVVSTNIYGYYTFSYGYYSFI